MTDAQRRYMHARQHVASTLVDPVTELLAATLDLTLEARSEAARARDLLEQLRPVWAMGNSEADQTQLAHAIALSEIWALLGVTDQTSAMTKLRWCLETAHAHIGS